MNPDLDPGRADRSPAETDESGGSAGLGSAHLPGDGAAAGSGPAPGGGGAVVDWLLVAFVTVVSALAALVAVAYLPWHIGVVPMPVSALLGVAAMVLAPRACYRLTGSMTAAVVPVLVWFGVTVWLVLSRNPMMRTQALSVVQGQWRVMVLLGLGSLAAAATLTLLWAERSQARYARADAEAGGAAMAPAAVDGVAGGAPGRVEADEPTGRSG